MRITSLSFDNFRNLGSVKDLEFPKSSLLIAAAPNATGKTNFLEALTILLRGKSFRSSNEDCVAWGEDYFLIQGLIDRGSQDSRLAVQYHKPTRKLRIEEDGVPVSPVVFYSHYPYVLFLPEDTFLFERGPAMRRNFFNTTLVSSSQYLSSIVQYHRTLRQRNAALKGASSPDDLMVWTDLLVGQATSVWAQRESFVTYLGNVLSELYARLFDEEHDIEVLFVPGAADSTKYADLLTEAWQYEKKYGYTLYGPHRDDMKVRVNGRSAQAALSRGQMRSLVIALKVAAWQFMKQLTGQEPLLLFDEVLSELDERRQKALLASMPNAQTVLTCTSVPAGVRDQEGVYMLDLSTIVRDGNKDSSHIDVEEEQKEEVVVVASGA